jgi:DmsE family decaheme c-type cytochrome
MRRVFNWAFGTTVAFTLVGGPLVCPSADATEEGTLPAVAAIIPPEADGEYAGGGVETCIDCHDETEKYPVLSILKTKHAVQADLRTPLASDEACEVCHGPSMGHEEDSEVPPGVIFGRDAPAGPQNDACLQCHQRERQLGWLGSTHEARGLACVSCHTIHTADDPVFGRTTRPDMWAGTDSQAGVCFTCHPQQRAEAQRISTHPIRDGKAACSSCHDSHGGWGPNMLVKPTLNETCYSCHAEKRGPFLWEHAPAREDCSICHAAHGTNHPPMLIARGPWLCQQCHLASYHPSAGYTGAYLPPNLGGSSSNKLLAGECRNCHPEVHGSNHPSGVRWTR